MNAEQMKRRDELATKYVAGGYGCDGDTSADSYKKGYDAGHADAKIQCISDMVDHPAYQTSKQIEKEFENYRDESFIRERDLKQQVADYEAALKCAQETLELNDITCLQVDTALNKYGVKG